MLKLARPKLLQFSLRTLLLAITVSSVALAYRTRTFEVDITDEKEFRLGCTAGMTQERVAEYRREQLARREIGTVYRDFHGNLVKHGLSVLYDGNGVKLRQRHWSHGKLDGIAINWDKNRSFPRETTYRDGKRHGWEKFSPVQRRYYENDLLLREECSTSDGKFVRVNHPDGTKTWTTWSRAGVKLSQFDLDQQIRRQGPTSVYHANGNIRVRGAWLNNHEHGNWTWRDETGKVLRKVTFNDGERQPQPVSVRREKYICEDDPFTTINPALSKCLVGTFDDVAYDVSLSDALLKLEIDSNDQYSHYGAIPIRILFRNADVLARLDDAQAPQGVDREILRDALKLMLTPLRLEAVVHDNCVWIVDAEEARAWLEAVPVSRFVGEASAYTLDDCRGLKLGRLTLQSLFDDLEPQLIKLRLHESLVAESATLLAREVDADIPGCSLGTALDIVLHELGLTYYADNDQFVVVPLETP